MKKVFYRCDANYGSQWWPHEKEYHEALEKIMMPTPGCRIPDPCIQPTESQAADLFGYIHKTISALNEPEPKKQSGERTIYEDLSADYSDKIFSGRIGWKA